VRWKPDGTSTFVNEAYCRYFGQSREQLIGASFLHLIAEEDRQALLDRVARLTPADPVTTYIHHEAKPDGTPVWLEWTDRALFDENGRLVELQSVGRDVTQRREMEEERERLLAAEREQRELAETLLEMDSILSASLDRERVLSLMLEQLARVVVYDNASVMLVSGNTLDLVAQRGLDSPEPLPPRLQIQDLPHVQEVLESRRPRTIPDIRAAAGWLHQPASPPSGSTEGQHVRCWLGVPLVVQDRAIGLLNLGHAQPGFYDAEHAELVEAFAAHAALAIENARLLEAERQQHRLAEALRHAAAAVSSTLDLDQVLDRILQQVTHVIPGDAAKILLIEDGRARAVRWRGYERFGIQDQIASLAFPVADMQALRQMQETGSPIVIPHTHAYAGWIRVPEMEWLRSYVAAPIRARDKDGVPAVIGFLTVDSATPGFFTGVHADRLQTFADQASMAIQNAHLYEDLRRQMQELQSAQTQLVQSAKMAAIGELAAGVAHELNNPLTSVLGFSELLLRDTEADAPAHNDLAIIVEETRRARDIVRGLLTFAHQTASTPEPADLNQVLQQTLSLIRRQIELRRVTLHETYADDLPYIPLDASRLKQVILNLVTNALDAMPRGGTLTVSTRRVADDLAISFADTGTGIAQDHLPRIFEPFFTTKPTGQGIGLGLSVSLGIIQEHGGRIDVESRVGEGSTFTVWLPGDQEDAPAPPVGPDPEGPPGGA
jgi:PAS domain S-box-containing protein